MPSVVIRFIPPTHTIPPASSSAPSVSLRASSSAPTVRALTTRTPLQGYTSHMSSSGAAHLEPKWSREREAAPLRRSQPSRDLSPAELGAAALPSARFLRSWRCFDRSRNHRHAAQLGRAAGFSTSSCSAAFSSGPYSVSDLPTSHAPARHPLASRVSDALIRWQAFPRGSCLKARWSQLKSTEAAAAAAPARSSRSCSRCCSRCCALTRLASSRVHFCRHSSSCASLTLCWLRRNSSGMIL